jgi:hypothetical protein
MKKIFCLSGVLIPIIFLLVFSDCQEPVKKTIVNSVSSEIKGGDTVWHEVGTAVEPSFQDTWTNYGNGAETCAFRKDGENFVHIKGVVKGGHAISYIYTLPAGYRPANIQCYVSMDNNSVLIPINIKSTGEVQMGGNPFTGSMVLLDGIVFYADW